MYVRLPKSLKQCNAFCPRERAPLFHLSCLLRALLFPSAEALSQTSKRPMYCLSPLRCVSSRCDSLRPKFRVENNDRYDRIRGRILAKKRGGLARMCDS